MEYSGLDEARQITSSNSGALQVINKSNIVDNTRESFDLSTVAYKPLLKDGESEVLKVGDKIQYKHEVDLTDLPLLLHTIKISFIIYIRLVQYFFLR